MSGARTKAALVGDSHGGPQASNIRPTRSKFLQLHQLNGDISLNKILDEVSGLQCEVKRAKHRLQTFSQLAQKSAHDLQGAAEDTVNLIKASSSIKDSCTQQIDGLMGLLQFDPVSQDRMDCWSPFFLYFLVVLWTYYCHCILLQTTALKTIVDDQMATHPLAQMGAYIAYTYGVTGFLRQTYMCHRTCPGEKTEFSDPLKHPYSLISFGFARVAIPLFGAAALEQIGVNIPFRFVPLVAIPAASLGQYFMRKENERQEWRSVLNAGSSLLMIFASALSASLAWHKAAYDAVLGFVLIPVAELAVMQVRRRTIYQSGYAYRVMLLVAAMFLMSLAIKSQSADIATKNGLDPWRRGSRRGFLGPPSPARRPRNSAPRTRAACHSHPTREAAREIKSAFKPCSSSCASNH
ncbi:unnamed protein product [Cyprideis torosa]|uniref:Uncharacterized protein n=1 Tax=Cyprideis torosa TaxID=163714 RepID=A0A7R8W5V8_9CRUS|nr:unnamed protein product [Cyprideis torosa]CAG0885745.1 unnamed protein product [Cyprideis torosa]